MDWLFQLAMFVAIVVVSMIARNFVLPKQKKELSNATDNNDINEVLKNHEWNRPAQSLKPGKRSDTASTLTALPKEFEDVESVLSSLYSSHKITAEEQEEVLEIVTKYVEHGEDFAKLAETVVDLCVAGHNWVLLLEFGKLVPGKYQSVYFGFAERYRQDVEGMPLLPESAALLRVVTRAEAAGNVDEMVRAYEKLVEVIALSRQRDSSGRNRVTEMTHSLLDSLAIIQLHTNYADKRVARLADQIFSDVVPLIWSK